jgi:serpin B
MNIKFKRILLFPAIIVIISILIPATIFVFSSCNISGIGSNSGDSQAVSAQGNQGGNNPGEDSSIVNSDNGNGNDNNENGDNKEENGGEGDRKPVEHIDLEVADRNNEFAFNIFGKLLAEETNPNIFISPFSISTALAMTYNGAARATKEEMAAALEFSGLELDKINSDFNKLISLIEKTDEEIKIKIANSIWKREELVVLQDFLDRNEKYFNSEIKSLDLDDPAAPAIINKWIEDNTEGKIDKMIDSIDPYVVMYLINAIYFNGFWTYQFDKENTELADFYPEEGRTVLVEMMSQKAEFYHKSFDGFEVLKLPYGENKEYSMHIVLPDENGQLDKIIEKLDSAKWEEIKDSLDKKEIDIFIPKFKIDYGIKELSGVLQELGMIEAFSFNADFSGICPDIYISRVLHKALIEVNEEGSEAAAATVVEMKCVAYEEVPQFNANRPFFFTISDEASGSILFMGKYSEPNDTE